MLIDDPFGSQHDQSQTDDTTRVHPRAQHPRTMLVDLQALDVDVGEDHRGGGGSDEDTRANPCSGPAACGGGNQDTGGHFGDEEERDDKVAIEAVEEEELVAYDGGELELRGGLAMGY